MVLNVSVPGHCLSFTFDNLQARLTNLACSAPEVDLNFNIVNVPFLDGDVPQRPSYGVNIS